jgi:hypothetical protein
MWFILPFLKPSYEVARRFRGKVAWNGLLIEKSETLHSLSFKTSNWVELKGFEMLCGDFSFKITYTLTKGQGVMGKRITRGTDYIKTGALITPIKQVKFLKSKRLEPNTWYTINIVICIHEYDMNLITSLGSGGIKTVETDCGVVVEYCPGLESCSKTNSDSGQIVGILFSRIHPDDEQFYNEERQRRKSSASTHSVQDSAVGSDHEIDILPYPLRQSRTEDAKNVDPKAEQSSVQVTTIQQAEAEQKLEPPQEYQPTPSQYPVSPPVVPTNIDLGRPALVSSSSGMSVDRSRENSNIRQPTPVLFQQPAMFQDVLKSQSFLQIPPVSNSRPALVSNNQSSAMIHPNSSQRYDPNSMRTEDILKQYMYPHNRH